MNTANRRYIMKESKFKNRSNLNINEITKFIIIGDGDNIYALKTDEFFDMVKNYCESKKVNHIIDEIVENTEAKQEPKDNSWFEQHVDIYNKKGEKNVKK